MSLILNGFSLHRQAVSSALLAAAMAFAMPALADDSQLTIQSETGDHSFTVEVVDTPELRAKGLMFRMNLEPDAGMLFDFEEDRQVAFWMQNTFIPLDMLFITSDGTIQNIAVNAVPHDTTSIPSRGPVRFVLEIPGGRAVELGIKPGDIMVHDRVVPKGN
jgi:uncharacterized membrane protein (UPF0127 family)